MTLADVEVNNQGRVTIPAQMRHELGLTPGTKVVAYVEDGRLVVESRQHLLERTQQAVLRAAHEQGNTGAVVDELISERRTEAARDESDGGTT